MTQSQEKQETIYECGQLRYTFRQVCTLVGLLMLAFVFLSFATSVVANFIPIHLKDLKASNTLIVFIMSTIGSVFNITVCPTVSFLSDRYRGRRWGRRFYYIITTLPMYGGALVLFAFSDPVGAFIARCFHCAPLTATIGFMAVVMVIYQFFYMFVGSVIYYTYNDLIPQQFLARAIGVINIGLNVMGMLFNFFLMQYARTHFMMLMLAGGLVYLIGMSLICFTIKEQTFPPLTEEEKRQGAGLLAPLTFMKESFADKIYWYIALATAFTCCSACIGGFSVFFFENMGLDLKRYGELNATIGLFSLPLSFAVPFLGAIIVDKWHAARLYPYLSMLLVLVYLEQSKWVLFDIPAACFFSIYLVGSFAGYLLGQLRYLAGMPFLMQLYPKSRFGQFCSAQSMFRAFVVMVMGICAGVLIDYGQKGLELGERVYRYMYLWPAVFFALGSVFYYLTYYEWQKLGGESKYQAPARWMPGGFEKIDGVVSVVSTPQRYRWGVWLWDAVMLLIVAAPFALAKYALGGNTLFLQKTLPWLAALVVFYLFLRVAFTLRRRRGQSIPYFGILLISGIQAFFILGLAIYEIIATSSLPGAFDIAARFWNVECAIVAFILIATAIFGCLERPSASTVQETP